MIEVELIDVVEYQEHYYTIAEIDYYTRDVSVFIQTDKKFNKGDFTYDENWIDLSETLLDSIHKKMKSRRLDN